MTAHETSFEALARWMEKVRWALEGCHEHVGTDYLRMVAEAEANFRATFEEAEHGN